MLVMPAALATLLIIATDWSPVVPPDRRYISIEEARHLVYEMVKRKNADAIINYSPKGNEQDFYAFGAEIGGDPPELYYKVNRWTGDVWSVFGVVCRRLSSSELTNLQANI